MADLIFDDDVLALAARVVEEAVSAGVSLGTAESCTGGLVAAALTSVSGSSAVTRGSIVSYDPAVKVSVLGVERSVVEDPELGVVSSPCAQQMAAGALRVLGCDVAVSVTGIAGPGGAEPGKPVGTVWLGLATPVGATARLYHFGGSRSEVRLAATVEALALLREGIGDAAGCLRTQID